MLFRAASVAFLACAAHAAAKPQPYKLAVMAVPHLSLSRRDTLGCQPEEIVCNKGGDTCADACDVGYVQCPSNDDTVHCYNPTVEQLCCTDGSGNSCDKGYYCTHDSQSETWCCPDSMDLEECAAAYGVNGGLETAAASTSISTTSSEEPTTTVEAVTHATTPEAETTTCETPVSSAYTSKWTSANSTSVRTSAQVVTSTKSVDAPVDTTEPQQPGSTDEPGAASASGVSLALLIAGAGFVALF